MNGTRDQLGDGYRLYKRLVWATSDSDITYPVSFAFHQSLVNGGVLASLLFSVHAS
jgi:hypothetical protein